MASKLEAKPTDVFRIVNPERDKDLLKVYPAGTFTRADAEQMRLLALTGALTVKAELIALDRLMALRKIAPETPTAPETALIPPSPEECLDKALDGLTDADRAVLLANVMDGQYKAIAPLYKCEGDADMFAGLAASKLRTPHDVHEQLQRSMPGRAYKEREQFLATYSGPVLDETEPVLLDKWENVDDGPESETIANLYAKLNWTPKRAAFMASVVSDPPMHKGTVGRRAFIKALFHKVAKHEVR